jgi:hypothetical protein
MMKTILLSFALLLSSALLAKKQTPAPHGTVFGTKPRTMGMISASKLEAFMAKKNRLSITIEGKVLKVTKPNGGWFNLDAGHGKIINAHFKNTNINIPNDLKGRTVIVEGVAQKLFIADDQQHFAGDTVKSSKQPNAKKPAANNNLTFEVSGLMIEK